MAEEETPTVEREYDQPDEVGKELLNGSRPHLVSEDKEITSGQKSSHILNSHTHLAEFSIQRKTSCMNLAKESVEIVEKEEERELFIKSRPQLVLTHCQNFLLNGDKKGAEFFEKDGQLEGVNCGEIQKDKCESDAHARPLSERENDNLFELCDRLELQEKGDEGGFILQGKCEQVADFSHDLSIETHLAEFSKKEWESGVSSTNGYQKREILNISEWVSGESSTHGDEFLSREKERKEDNACASDYCGDRLDGKEDKCVQNYQLSKHDKMSGDFFSQGEDYYNGGIETSNEDNLAEFSKKEWESGVSSTNGEEFSNHSGQKSSQELNIHTPITEFSKKKWEREESSSHVEEFYNQKDGRRKTNCIDYIERDTHVADFLNQKGGINSQKASFCLPTPPLLTGHASQNERVDDYNISWETSCQKEEMSVTHGDEFFKDEIDTTRLLQEERDKRETINYCEWVSGESSKHGDTFFNNVYQKSSHALMANVTNKERESGELATHMGDISTQRKTSCMHVADYEHSKMGRLGTCDRLEHMKMREIGASLNSTSLISHGKREKEDGDQKFQIGRFGWNKLKNVMPISSIQVRRMTRIDEEEEKTHEAPTHENTTTINPTDSIVDGFHTSSRRTLHYVMPESQNGIPIVKPKKDIVEEGAKKWNATAIGYLLGKKPYFYHLQSFIRNTWKGVKDIIAAANGFFLFVFETKNLMEDVIQGGPWLFNGQPIFLQKWHPGMSMERQKHRHVPVWIKLKNLPLEYWTSEGLSVVASGVGQPLYPDSVTRRCSRIDYARVCVLVDMEGPLPKVLVIVKPSIAGGIEGPCKIDIEYEWLPIKCHSCRGVGHDATNCPNQKKDKKTPMLQIYLPKKPNPMRSHQYKQQKIRQQWVPKGETRPCPSTSNNRPNVGNLHALFDDHLRGTRPTTHPFPQSRPQPQRTNKPNATPPGTRLCSRPCLPRPAFPNGGGEIILYNSFAALEDVDDGRQQIQGKENKPEGPKHCSPSTLAP